MILMTLLVVMVTTSRLLVPEDKVLADDCSDDLVHGDDPVNYHFFIIRAILC